MKKTLSRLASIICVILILESCNTAFAQDSSVISQNDISTFDVDENYYITSVDKGYKETFYLLSDIRNFSVSIDDVMANSVNVKSVSSSSYSGSFTSDKYSAGIPGYKYQIKFDWESGTLNGTRVFTKIKNYKVVTYTNYVVLSLAWESYSYRLTKNTYLFDRGNTLVNCYTNYAFDVRDKTTHNSTTIYQNNTQTFSLNSLL